MKNKTTRTKNPALVAGQLWQLDNCYVRITGVGKSLTEYKLLRQPEQRAAKFQLGNHASVAAYLKLHMARLIETLPVDTVV